MHATWLTGQSSATYALKEICLRTCAVTIIAYVAVVIPKRSPHRTDPSVHSTHRSRQNSGGRISNQRLAKKKGCSAMPASAKLLYTQFMEDCIDLLQALTISNPVIHGFLDLSTKRHRDAFDDPEATIRSLVRTQPTTTEWN